MHPSRASRLTVSPVAKFLKVEFGFGPPVPAAGLFALDECGHPNCCVYTHATMHKSQSLLSVPQRNAQPRFGLGSLFQPSLAFASRLIHSIINQTYQHEISDDAVKVQSIIKSRLRQIDEIRRRDRHLIEVKLRFKRALGRVENCDWISHYLLLSSRDAMCPIGWMERMDGRTSKSLLFVDACAFALL